MSYSRIPQDGHSYTRAASSPIIPGKSKSLFESGVHAIDGIKYAFGREINLRVHLLVLVAVIVFAWIVQIELWQWLLIIFISATIVAFELVNSAIEALADAVHPTFHIGIAHAKDVAAGAVLIIALMALLEGILIFAGPVARLLAI